LLLSVLVVALVAINSSTAKHYTPGDYLKYDDFYRSSRLGSAQYVPTQDDEKMLKELFDAQMQYEIITPKRKPTDYGKGDSADDVKFFIYGNKMNPDEFHEIDFNDKPATRMLVNRGIIKPMLPWKFLIHGFEGWQNSTFPLMAVDQYLWAAKWNQEKDVNVVVVDWGRLCYGADENVKSSFPPSQSLRNIMIAGKRLGDMITLLKKLRMRELTPVEKGKFPSRKYLYPIMDMSEVHLIGFCLGANVAGKAGEIVKNEIKRKIGRITGLDPAGPLFGKEIGRTLDKRDAEAVDVIHTNAGRFGITENIGDTDFWVNSKYWDNGIVIGSQVQPACTSKFGLLLKNSETKRCSHLMAPVYFTLSINNPEMLTACKECKPTIWSDKASCRCKSTDVQMGEEWDMQPMGDMYISI